MTTISTIEPVADRLAPNDRLSERATEGQDVAFPNRRVVRLGGVGSSNWRCMTAPDGSIREIYRASVQLKRFVVFRDSSPAVGVEPYSGSESSNWSSSIDVNLRFEPLPPDEFEPSVASVAIIQSGWPFEPYIISNRGNDSDIELHPEVEEFALGVGGAQPCERVIVIASRIVREVLERTADSEISVDVDGALSFVLRLNDGRLVLAELAPDGVIDASRYDNEQGANIERFPRLTAKDLINLF